MAGAFVGLLLLYGCVADELPPGGASVADVPPDVALTDATDDAAETGGGTPDVATLPDSSPDAPTPDAGPDDAAGVDAVADAIDAGAPDAQPADSDTDAAECVPAPSGLEECNGRDDDCDGELDEGTCDDGDPCTLDLCDQWQGCVNDDNALLCCETVADCYDGDSCTIDICEGGMCSFALDLPGYCCFEDSDCGDSDDCTEDVCNGGFCQHHVSDTEGCCNVASDCDDGDACTQDTCQTHHCFHEDLCCASDAECDDGDAKCTSDLCLEKACVHVTTEASGCCAASAYFGDFEDGTPEGHAIYNSVPGTGWQVVETPLAMSGTRCLYYGNPATWTYDTGAQSNYGSATGPVVTLPGGVDVRMRFWLWMSTEATPTTDRLVIRVLLVEDGVVSKLPVIWTKQKLSQYGAWVPVEVDLTAFAGGVVRVSFDFNTIDAVFNAMPGIYIDDIEVISTCAARTCAGPEGCDDHLTITSEKCAGGYCSYALEPGYCEWDYECNDSNDCTQDACVENLCVNSETDGCCVADAECDDALTCTIDACIQSWPVNFCSHTWAAGCCANDAEGEAVGCDDGDPCTVDTCPVEGEPCAHAPLPGCCVSDAACDDENACTADICQKGTCLHLDQCCVTEDDCDDGDDACTVETCTNGKCVYDFVDLQGCCKQAMLKENFDAPGSNALQPATAPTGAVSWQASTTQAKSQPTAMWFGDPATGTYDAAGLRVTGALETPPLDIPVAVFTQASLWVYLANEYSLGDYANAEWDRLRVEAQPLDLQQQPDGAPVVLWDSAWGAPVWWATGPDGAPVGPKWTHIEHLDLTPFAGKSVRVRVVFDSLDGDANGYPGAWVDDFAVVRTCGPTG